MNEQRINVNGVGLQVREHPHGGEALLLLHFGGANLEMWRRVVPHFQDRYHLVLVDLRGHGRSDCPESGYSMDEMAADVHGILQALGIGRTHIIGSSLGAEVGLSLAVHAPARVASLVCDGALSSEFGPYSTWEGSKADFQEHVAYELERMGGKPESIFPSVDALVTASRSLLEPVGWWNEHVEVMERYGARRLGEGQYTKAFQKPARIDYMRYYFQARFEAYYGRLSCPVLMLPGGDAWSDERERLVIESLSRLAPGARIEPVPGWVHPYGWLLGPEAACQAVDRFLAEQAPSLS